MILRAENITKSFGEVPVISGFSHDFTSGAVTALMGQSGCGKTTLLNLLMGIIPPDSGNILRDGRISAVFQENRLCENLSVMSNLRLVMRGKPSHDALEAALSEVGLGGCGSRPVRELSGGMKRRTALLRALLAEYDILFLDEPFKGLDDETRQTVMAYCKLETAGKTVILVTHDKAEAEFFNAECIICS
ncbi:MAG: ABC transporter ATP-binding protein [Ruminiclostridium sp.]|nr:ABC transporter ATP-binding protein [Ruminiclostridium sp.]